MKRSTTHAQSGQALVALLCFMAMAITITTAAVIVTLVNAQTTSKYTLGQETLSIAESGIDNAMLRLARDPAYTGETLTVGNGTVTITVSGSPTITITSVGTMGNFRRTIEATASRTNNTLVISSWKETP
ncbi:MAG TPA: hypothetical protein VLA88_03760 [Candidatus Saccharimonadales bacterium]|nr:hypothetical protein [Candidatus Saccharimonadales bacterium]